MPKFSAATLSKRILALSTEVVPTVVDETYRRHPELESRFGSAGRATCAEDTRYHIEYLASSIALGRVEPFAFYLQWLANLLEKRGIARPHLVEALQLLQPAVERRLAPAERTRVAPVFEAGLHALESTAPSLPAFFHRLPPPLPETTPFTEALLAGNNHDALQLALTALARARGVTELNTRLVQAGLYQVGQLWLDNRISVAREHLATAVAQNVMSHLFARASFTPPNGRRCLLSCVAGNHHSLGLRMVSDAFELEGWEVQYLGADTPTPALLDQVEKFRPQVAALSISMVPQLETIRDITARMHERLGADCPLILAGGLALNLADDLWRSTGADAWLASAEEIAGWQT